MERKIGYVPISKLSRGYAGQIIDNMNNEKTILYIMRNNVPQAVLMPIEEFDKYQESLNSKVNKHEIVEKLSGSLSQYKDPSKIGKEREFYIQGLMKKYGK